MIRNRRHRKFRRCRACTLIAGKQYKARRKARETKGTI
jgi:hypothetical protein